MTDPRILHETTYGIDAPGQRYGLIRTYQVGGRSLRVTVEVDGYRHQSVYRADVWHDEWREVVRIAGQDPMTATLASGHVPAEQSHKKSASLERMAGELLDRARQVVAEMAS